MIPLGYLSFLVWAGLLLWLMGSAEDRGMARRRGLRVKARLAGAALTGLFARVMAMVLAPAIITVVLQDVGPALAVRQ